jgi:MFS family permease
VSIYSLGEVVGGILFGRLSDRWSVKQALLLSMVVGMIGTFLFASAANGVELILSRILWGVYGGSTATLTRAYISRATSTQLRSQAMAINICCFCVSYAAGPYFGGLIAKLIGDTSWSFDGSHTPWSFNKYRGCGWILCGLMAISFFIILFAFHELPIPAAAQKDAGDAETASASARNQSTGRGINGDSNIQRAGDRVWLKAPATRAANGSAEMEAGRTGDELQIKSPPSPGTETDEASQPMWQTGDASGKTIAFIVIANMVVSG